MKRPVGGETFLWFGVFVLATAVPLNTFLWRRMRGRTLEHTGGVAPSAKPAAAPPTRPTPFVLSISMLQVSFCLAIIGCCISMSMPLAHLIAHASDLGHATARAAEMLATALFVATAVRLVAGTLLVDRFGGLVALLVFSAAQTAALMLYAMVDGMLALYLVSVLFGLGYGGINMCYPVIVQEHLPAAESGRRLGVVLLFGALGMALGGALAGYIFDLTGSYTPAFLIGAAFNVANLVIILTLINRKRSAPAQPAVVSP